MNSDNPTDEEMLMENAWEIAKQRYRFAVGSAASGEDMAMRLDFMRHECVAALGIDAGNLARHCNYDEKIVEMHLQTVFDSIRRDTIRMIKTLKHNFAKDDTK